MKKEIKIETAAEKKILIIPRVETGKGGGHLLRSATLLKELRMNNAEAYMFISEDKRQSPVMKIVDTIDPVNPDWIISRDPDKQSWHFIILDNFKTSDADYMYWSSLAPIPGIDRPGPD